MVEQSTILEIQCRIVERVGHVEKKEEKGRNHG